MKKIFSLILVAFVSVSSTAFAEFKAIWMAYSEETNTLYYSEMPNPKNPDEVTYWMSMKMFTKTFEKAFAYIPDTDDLTEVSIIDWEANQKLSPVVLEIRYAVSAETGITYWAHDPSSKSYKNGFKPVKTDWEFFSRTFKDVPVWKIDPTTVSKNKPKYQKTRLIQD